MPEMDLMQRAPLPARAFSTQQAFELLRCGAQGVGQDPVATGGRIGSKNVRIGFGKQPQQGVRWQVLVFRGTRRGYFCSQCRADQPEPDFVECGVRRLAG